MVRYSLKFVADEIEYAATGMLRVVDAIQSHRRDVKVNAGAFADVLRDRTRAMETLLWAIEDDSGPGYGHDDALVAVWHDSVIVDALHNKLPVLRLALDGLDNDSEAVSGRSLNQCVAFASWTIKPMLEWVKRARSTGELQ